MKVLTKPIHRSFSAGMLFFFQWIFVHIVVFTLWWIVKDELWDVWHIMYRPPLGMDKHWTFWLSNKLGDPWPMMVYLFASFLATPAMFGIMLGKLQYFVLRQQGYRDNWWVLMTCIAPLFMVGFAQSIMKALVDFAIWLTLLIAPPIVSIWGGIGNEMITMAGGLGFGVTQWLLLRRRFRRSAWWMVATALGEALWGFRYLGLSKSMYGVTEGAIKGTLTGLTMMWLLRYSAKRVAPA